MSKTSANLAHAITRNSSTQSYTIACLLADKDLRDDCLRAYAYFRWADDEIDVAAATAAERIAFIQRQKCLVDALYRGERPADLVPEEEMVADLIANDRGDSSGLQSFIRNFITVLEFDAGRKGRLISQAELIWYSHCLGKAVTDAIQYFIGNDQPHPNSPDRYLAATAAHITHMLRDMSDDLAEGFFNVPREWQETHNLNLTANNIGSVDLNDPSLRAWVRNQVELARADFRVGKRYLDELNVLRCKIAGYWYCARFECVLDVIESDDYVLRPRYDQPGKLSAPLKMGWLALSLTLQHFLHRVRRRGSDVTSHSGYETPVAEH